MRRALWGLIAAMSACDQPVVVQPLPLSRTEALTLSSELELIPSATQRGDPTGNQTNPSAAGIGTNLLTVFEDTRFGVSDSRVMAAWVTGANGSNPIISRFLLAPGNTLQTVPRVAAGTGEFLVVFLAGPFGAQDVQGVWVSNTTGLPGPAFTIAATPNSEGNPRVAVNTGVNPPVFAVLWQDTYSVGPLNAVLLQEGATTPLSGPAAIADGPSNEEDPTLAFNGVNFITAWKDNRNGNADIYTVSFSPTMLPASSSAGVLPLTGGPTKVAPILIGGTGGQSLLMFFNLTAERAARLNGTTQVDPPPFITPFPTTNSQPAGYFDGANSRYQLINASFTPTDLLLITVNSADGGTGVLSDNMINGNIGPLAAARFLNSGQPYPYATWYEPTAWGSKVRGYRVYEASDLPQPAEGEESQEHPSAAAFGSGTEAVVAWKHALSFPGDAGTSVDVGWRVFRADGGHSAPTVLALPGLQGAPSTATAGQRALVAFNDVKLAGGRGNGNFSINTALFDATNSDSPTQVKIADPTESPVVAGAVGGQFLLVWPETATTNLHVRRLPPLATFTDGGFSIVSTGSALALSQALSLAFAQRPGNGGLVASVLGTANTTGPFEVRVQRVDEDAGFSAGVLVTSQAAGNVGESLVSADWDGTNFVVAWVDGRNPVTAPDVYAARISAAGASLDGTGVPIESGLERARDVRLSFNGRHHVLATSLDLPDGGTDIALHLLRPDLTLLYDAGIITAEPEKEPALAMMGDAGTLIAFTRSKLDPTVQANRVFATVLTVGLGDHCVSAADCHSGFCTQGVCCDTACGGACETCLAAQGATADGTCTPRPATAVCRSVAAGGCDVAESCDGVSAACPADAFAPATVLCRPASQGGCDLAEYCPGGSPLCPADRFADAGAVCNSATSPCAASATCNGADDLCPVAGLKPAGVTCRPADGGCDLEEQCDGVSQACPQDQWLSTSEVCRPAAGPCDIAEHCTGAGPQCPPDVLVSDNSVCRVAASSCDLEERCNGAGPGCPADDFVVDGGACTNGAGICIDAVCQASDAGNETVHEGSPYGFGCGCGSTGGPGFMLGLAAWLARRRRRAAWLAMFATAAVSTAAFAAPKQQRLIFQTVRAGSGVSVETATAVTDFVHSELSQVGAYEVIGQTELAAMIGVERQKQLMGCSEESSSCFAELSGALDAERMVVGDLSRIDDLALLNLSLVDLKHSRPIARVGRKVSLSGSKLGPLLDEVRPMLLELLNKDPSNAGRPLTQERGFGGFVLGVAGAADVLGPSIAPAVTAELSGRWVGGALTVLPKASFGARLEARFYPVVLGIVRPYIAAGVTAFTTELGIRGAAGLSVRIVSGLQAFVDAGYERFVVQFAPSSDVYNKDAVILGFGLGWQI